MKSLIFKQQDQTGHPACHRTLGSGVELYINGHQRFYKLNGPPNMCRAHCFVWLKKRAPVRPEWGAKGRAGPLFLLFVYRFSSSLVEVTHPLTLASYFPLLFAIFDGFRFALVYKPTAKKQLIVAVLMGCRDLGLRKKGYK
jgi:hypothetical protein